jgi:hypothetical protein
MMDDRRLERILILLIAILVVGGLGLWAYQDRLGLTGNIDETATRILWVGNSYTMGNNLPQMFEDLAEAGGHKVQTGEHTRPGWRLDEHVESNDLAIQLENRPWDYVVLQEQSIIPPIDDWRDYNMLPAVQNLHPRIQAAGGKTLLFMTWGYRNGEAAFTETPDYETMQERVTQAYYKIGRDTGAGVAPVGVGWRRVVNGYSGVNLWEADGSHP